MKFSFRGAPLGVSNPLLLLMAACSLSRAEDAAKIPPVPPPSETELRTVITKGLGFLATAGDQWMADKNCISCHHLAGLVWSHREAKARGFAVEEKKFTGWIAGCDERVKVKKPGIEEAAMMILALPERPAPELKSVITAFQQPDGAWKPGIQLATMQKRGAPDAQTNVNLLALLALGTPQPPPPEFEAARAKALDAMKADGKPTSMESMVFHLHYARRFGTPEETSALLQDVLKLQRGDGGWSFINGENMSDPLASGLVLHVLQPTAADPPTAEAISRAQRWLVNSQREDGSWAIDITHISKLDRSGTAKAKSFADTTGIYTYWGTSWAVLGLLQGVPVK